MDFVPRCPICRAIVQWDGNAHRPFCSERCQLIDLGQWTTEKYRVAGSSAELGAPMDAETSDDGDSDEGESS